MQESPSRPSSWPLAAAAALGLLIPAASAGAPPDPMRGAALFQDRCALCHMREGGGQAPSLVGVVGRPAAATPDAVYTRALSVSGLIWVPETLDRFLADPSALVPGTAMPVSIADPRDRADLVAFLASSANRS